MTKADIVRQIAQATGLTKTDTGAVVDDRYLNMIFVDACDEVNSTVLVAGTDFVGTPVELGPTGRPQIILFLAHWCGHCQNEVPLVQAWIDGGGLGDDVDLFSVATRISADADNYPPDAWLEREGWTPEVLVDTTDDVARAYGLGGFPYWVFVDGDGAVRGRWTGPIAIDDLAITVGQLSG